MKVILREGVLEKELLNPTPAIPKRNNVFNLNYGEEYAVKNIIDDNYGLAYKLLHYSHLYNAELFYVKSIDKNEKVYARVNIYTIAEDGITKDSKVEPNTLNVVCNLNLRTNYKLKEALWSESLKTWLFYIEDQELPVLQKYMEVIKIEK